MRQWRAILAGIQKGLERICPRIVDRRRNALNEGKALPERCVYRLHFVREADALVKRTESILVIEHERCCHPGCVHRVLVAKLYDVPPSRRVIATAYAPQPKWASSYSVHPVFKFLKRQS